MVVVVGISLSVLSSAVVFTKAAVLETKFKSEEAERKREEADAEAERKRKEADAEAERKRKEADAEAERKRKEEVEAERKRKEAEVDDYVENARAASEWATMLNNFTVARTLRKGDLTELVNNGFVGVPRELRPRVLKKLKKRTSSELQHCEGKYLTNKEENGFLRDFRVDPLEFGELLELRSELEHPDIKISKGMWDLFFSAGNKRYGEGEAGSAFEITKCYEKKTKNEPDYFELNNCERNKHLEYLRNCGGQDDLYCPCKVSEDYIASRFDAQKKI